MAGPPVMGVPHDRAARGAHCLPGVPASGIKSGSVSVGLPFELDSAPGSPVTAEGMVMTAKSPAAFARKTAYYRDYYHARKLGIAVDAYRALIARAQAETHQSRACPRSRAPWIKRPRSA
jgi:hypothetical protein